MSNEKRCERCGGVIPAGTPAGDCPGCLLEAGLGAGEAERDPLDRAELEALFPGLEIGDHVGRGGMGLVYKATQRSLGRTVALKLLSAEVAGQEAFAERFHREARALAKLNHPNIVGVHESGKAGDHYYFIMEYVDGVNLRQALETGGLTPKEALAIVPQICDALQYAHDQGVVHRDVKPENILLDQEGRVKMVDFGLAKLTGGDPSSYTLTREREGMGTLHYMAPEQLRSARDVDHRADIYSLGVVFYEMLTGDLPMGNFPPPSRKVEVDVRLDRVVLRAMERERERRYQRVDEFKTGVQCPEAAKPGAADDGGSRGPVAISKLAVTGILGVPVGLLAVAIAWAAGLRDQTDLGGIFAGIALLGIAFSALGWRAIKAEPERLFGLTLARLGTIYPLVFLGPTLVVLGVAAATQGSVAAAIAAPVGAVLFIVMVRIVAGHGPRRHRHPSGERPRSARVVGWVVLALIALFGVLGVAAALTWLNDPVYDLGDGRYVSLSGAKWVTVLRDEDVKRILAEVAAFDDGAPVSDLAGLYPPEDRRRLERMTPEELAEVVRRKGLGLGSVDRSTLPAPLTAFRIVDKEVHRHSAEVSIRHGDVHLRFPLAYRDKRWYLALGEAWRGEPRADGEND